MLKIISLNIEGDNHLSRILRFMQTQQPDMVCLQEVFKKDSLDFAKKLNMHEHFSPMVWIADKDHYKTATTGEVGITILSKDKPISKHSLLYFGSADDIPVLHKNNHPNKCSRVLSWIRVSEYTVANTHFTWSPDGQCSEEQIRDFESLEKALESIGDCVLCGDFNTPRGGMIFAKLAERFTDNIPKKAESTIDPIFHKNKNLKVVIDGVFSSPIFKINNIRLIGGLSDHKAIIGTITKKP